MTTYEWLTLGFLMATALGGLSAWVFKIREKAVDAFSRTEKNDVRIQRIEKDLERGNHHFDEIAKQFGEINKGISDIKSDMSGVKTTLDFIRNGTKGGST